MKRHLLSLCTILCSAVLLVSCEKDTDARANLMVVNLSPNGGNIDATANGSVIASNMAYPANSGYQAVTAGNVNLVVTPTGSSTAFINGTLATEANGHYTFYVVDSSHRRRGTFTRDDLSAPSAGKAKVRLLHFSPNAPAVDIRVNGNAVTAFNNRMFNDVSTNTSFGSFTEVDAGVMNLQINAAGTTTTIASLPPITVQAGKIYSVIVRGFAGATGTQALNFEVITHN